MTQHDRQTANGSAHGIEISVGTEQQAACDTSKGSLAGINEDHIQRFTCAVIVRKGKPLPVYGKGENVRDWLFVEDHARAIDLIFHEGKIAETYNIGGFNEWKNIDLIKVMIQVADRILGNPDGHSLGLITYVKDRAGHDLRYAIDSTKLHEELGWSPSLQFEEGIEKTIRWYLDHQEWMDRVTSGDYQDYYESMYKNR